MSGLLYNKDLELHEGITFHVEFRWNVTNGDRVSLNGVTGRMQIRKKLNSDTALLDVPSVTDPWVPDGKTGIYVYGDGSDDRYVAYIKDDDSLGICADHKNIPTAVYELVLYDSDGESILKQYGVIPIYAAVLR